MKRNNTQKETRTKNTHIINYMKLYNYRKMGKC